MSADLEIPIAADFLRDVLTGAADAHDLVDLIRAAGYSHETATVTLVVLADD